MENLKQKIYLIIFIVFYILFTLWSEELIDFSELNPNDYARITDVEYTATLIDEPGSQRKN